MHDIAPWSVAILLTAAIVIAAWRSGSLAGNGAVAALLIGLVALRVQWSWGAFLLAWFVLASLLSRIGRARKAVRTAGVVAKGDRRDARQVLANGGVFALCGAGVYSALAIGFPADTTVLTTAAAAALAAAGADTWATEVGTLVGGTPWSVREARRVPVGTSGAITASGTLGALFGGVAIAGIAVAVGMLPAANVIAVAIGGFVGALADTVVGAWWQEQRTCAACGQSTECLVHRCGATTVRVRGVAGLDNDLVNGICTVVGAAVATAIALAR